MRAWGDKDDVDGMHEQFQKELMSMVHSSRKDQKGGGNANTSEGKYLTRLERNGKLEVFLNDNLNWACPEKVRSYHRYRQMPDGTRMAMCADEIEHAFGALRRVCFAARHLLELRAAPMGLSFAGCDTSAQTVAEQLAGCVGTPLHHLVVRRACVQQTPSPTPD